MRSEFWFAFSWNSSTEFSVKTSSSSMSSVGSSAVNSTLLFLLDTLVLTSSENMLCKSSWSPLGELVEARVVSGSAAKGTDFLESMVSKLSKVSFDLPCLDLNWWKNPVWLLFERRFPSPMFSSKPQKLFAFIKIALTSVDFFGLVRLNIFHSLRMRDIDTHD